MRKFLLIILSIIWLSVAGQSRITGVYVSEVNLFKQDTFKYWISSFNHGIAKFSWEGYYGIIDTTGNVLVEPKYDEIIFFDDYILYSSNKRLKCTNYRVESVDIKEYGYEPIDNDKIYVPALDRYFFRYAFHDGLLRVWKEVAEGPYAFIDRQGNVVIDFLKYNRARDFSNGLACVESKGLWGTINIHGEEIVEPTYDYMANYSEGLAKVAIDSRVGFIDTAGGVIIPFIYESAENSNEGLIAVQKDGKYGFINHNGEVVLDFKYDLAHSFTSGLAKVKINNKEGYINRHGNFIYGPEDTLGRIYDKGKLTSVRKGKSWMFVDYKGNIIDTIVSDDPFYFDNDGYARFSRRLKYGAVNRLGEVIYYPGRTYWINQGISRYNYLNKWGFVDRNGNVILKPVYDLAFDFNGDIACVKLNNRWGAIDKKGDVLIPIKYISEHLHFGDFPTPLFRIV
ncbi:MAG TPA: WG repeat-containing protein [Bacteroidia bacterium]|nr:WG repeat-containing protein [Bacteroidia bacterium]